MKRSIILLSLVISVVLTACGTKETEQISAPNQETTKEISVSEEENEEADETQEVAVPEADFVENIDPYTKGLSTKEGFESEWIGIRFTAPEGTQMLTEEELNEAMNVSEEMLLKDSEELQKVYADMTSVTEMMCYVKEIAPSVVVSVNKVTGEVTNEQYLQSVKESLDKITTMTYTVLDDTKVATVGEKEFHVLNTKAEYDNQVIFQNYYVMKKDDRIVTITTTFTEATAEELETMMNSFVAY